MLAIVDINPESRVKVEQGPAKAELVEGGTRIFLGEGDQSGGRHGAARGGESEIRDSCTMRSTGSAEPQDENHAAMCAIAGRSSHIYRKQPMRPRLSGLGLEYQILEVYSRDQESALPRSASTSGRELRISAFEMRWRCCSMRCRRGR